MLAYHSDPSLKTRVLAELATHEAADRLRQHHGYWRQLDGQFRGCGVGCTLESIRAAMGLARVEHNRHALYETYLGVPQVLAMYEDYLFERLSAEAARIFPRRFLASIPVGADLSMVWPRWMRAVLAEPGGVQAGVARRPAIKPAVDGVIALYDRWLAGERPLAEDWRAARHAAASAASAADAADAASAAASAAYDAAAEVQRQADLLIRCLSEAPIREVAA
jgi:hypothetical protein